ncbi:MAG: hypothetical protein AAGI50_20125 [Pseudomonadota bacterium]
MSAAIVVCETTPHDNGAVWRRNRRRRPPTAAGNGEAGGLGGVDPLGGWGRPASLKLSNGERASAFAETRHDGVELCLGPPAPFV